jgi:thermostable 8-oxoguanine DNA glycosylase
LGKGSLFEMEPISGRNSALATQSLVSFDSFAEMWAYVSNYVETYRKRELEEFWSTVEKAAAKPFNEHFFVREHMWCVYVAGFSAATIGKKFPQLLLCHNIEDHEGTYLRITKDNIRAIDKADDLLAVFGNKRKAAAVQAMRQIILDRGWETLFKERLSTREPDALNGLPGIGPTLACHLARNLGNIDVVKPDVHLVRLAKRYGFATPKDMCRAASPGPLGRTDLILWLACADNGTL